MPDETVRWILEKPTDYFVQIGHGPNSSPEIYSGGPGFLLTAGGVNRGRRSQVVARPITLMLEDGATNLTQIVHLAGPGDTFTEWNNTGVWKQFAVAAGPVHIPAEWEPDASGPIWSVYRRGQDLCVAVHSRLDLGIVHLTRSTDPKSVLASMTNANGDIDTLKTSFQFREGKRITYDLGSGKNRWVLTSHADQPLDREFERWPRISGTGIPSL